MSRRNDADDKQEQYYSEAIELVNYNALALKAMCLWAHQHRDDKDAMQAASEAWGRNARYFAKAVDYFPSIVSDEPDVDSLLGLIYVTRLPRGEAYQVLGCISEDAENKYWQVRTRVDDALDARRNGHGAKRATLAEECADWVEVWRRQAKALSGQYSSYADSAFSDCAECLAEEPAVAAVLAKRAKAEAVK